MYGDRWAMTVVCVGLVGGLLASPATGQDFSLGESQKLDARIVELEKRVKIVELEKKLKEVQREGILASISLPPPTGTKGQQINAATREPRALVPPPPAPVSRPEVLSIQNRQGSKKLEALLKFKDGSRRIVREGDTLPGTGKVSNISARSVSVSYSSGKPEALSFATPLDIGSIDGDHERQRRTFRR